MNEEPAYLRAVSLHVSRTLDEIGLNELIVFKRRQTFLFDEQMGNKHFRLARNKIVVYHFGSQTEGSTTQGLDSDIDTLKCENYYHVIQAWDKWEKDNVNLLILQDKTAPGYCRLQLLRSDLPLAEENLPNENFTFDRRGRVILKNTFLHDTLSEAHVLRNGPAMSRSGLSGFADMDHVRALLCKSWPDQAKEFTRRQRRRGWPTNNIVQQAVNHGVFLVPVGHKLSSTEHLEWRISASLAERCLIFSLNIVHIKCYVVLKMLVKTFVEPCVSKCISSYHCKTAIFHCAESTDPDVWREDNLLQCVNRCLVTLLTWVTDGFCPHFIIPKENLFAGKVTINNRGKLQSVLRDLINNNVGALLRVHIDRLGENLQRKLNTVPSVSPVVDSLASLKFVGVFEYHRHASMSAWSKLTLVKDKSTEPVTVIRSFYEMIKLLDGHSDHSNKQEGEANRKFIEFLSCWLGSMIASLALSQKIKIPRQAILLLSIGAKSDIASMVKLASVLYFKGNLHIVEGLLKGLETHFCRNEMYAVCRCHNDHMLELRMTFSFCHVIYLLKRRKVRAKLFAHCVRFSPQETHCIPPALQMELHRSVGDEIKNRRPILDDWKDFAVVDCLPYLYYLQYITYKRLGKHDLQKRSLNNLDQCVRANNRFSHLETAWNILGQCQELEQKPEVAMDCYKTSLEIRPKDNAAKWHVAILWYKLISNK